MRPFRLSRATIAELESPIGNDTSAFQSERLLPPVWVIVTTQFRHLQHRLPAEMAKFVRPL